MPIVTVVCSKSGPAAITAVFVDGPAPTRGTVSHFCPYCGRKHDFELAPSASRPAAPSAPRPRDTSWAVGGSIGLVSGFTAADRPAGRPARRDPVEALTERMGSLRARIESSRTVPAPEVNGLLEECEELVERASFEEELALRRERLLLARALGGVSRPGPSRPDPRREATQLARLMVRQGLTGCRSLVVLAREYAHSAAAGDETVRPVVDTLLAEVDRFTYGLRDETATIVRRDAQEVQKLTAQETAPVATGAPLEMRSAR